MPWPTLARVMRASGDGVYRHPAGREADEQIAAQRDARAPDRLSGGDHARRVTFRILGTEPDDGTVFVERFGAQIGALGSEAGPRPVLGRRPCQVRVDRREQHQRGTGTITPIASGRVALVVVDPLVRGVEAGCAEPSDEELGKLAFRAGRAGDRGHLEREATEVILIDRGEGRAQPFPLLGRELPSFHRGGRVRCCHRCSPNLFRTRLPCSWHARAAARSPKRNVDLR